MSRVPEALMDARRAKILEVAEKYEPVTLRQLYYRLVSERVIEKSEAAYDALGKQCVNMRESGRMSWDWITDNTREWESGQRGGHGDIQGYVWGKLSGFSWGYTRSPTEHQPERARLYIEKDSLASTVSSTASSSYADLWSGRGFASVSYLHELAREIVTDGRPNFVYVVSDYDPSGIALADNVKAKILKFAAEIADRNAGTRRKVPEIHVERIALTAEQIVEHDLAGVYCESPKNTCRALSGKWLSTRVAYYTEMPLRD